MGCVVNAISYLDTACSGKTSCEYLVAGPDLAATHPCPKGQAPYLAVQYECIKGNIHVLLHSWINCYPFTRMRDTAVTILMQ